MSSRAQTVSLTLHLALVALLLLMAVHRPISPVPRETARILYTPAAHAPAGGGGMRSDEPVRKGVLPQQARRVFTPPTIQLVHYHPKLPVPMAIDNPPEMTPLAGAIGDANGVGLDGGSGGPDGLGDGDGPSIGPGKGNHRGSGRDGIYSMGQGITMPVPIVMIEPEYSEQARKARISGAVLVYAEIGPDGKPRNLKVTRSLGVGLDTKALDAVAKWLFKPGLKGGQPVTVRATFEVNFRLL